MTPMLIQLHLGQTGTPTDTSDPLIDQITENELYFLAALLFFLIMFIVGILSRRIESLMAVGFALCALLILMALLIFN